MIAGIINTIKVLFTASIFCWSALGLAANHQPGLHLQLQDVTVAIKRSDVEDIQVFHPNAEKASAVIRLRPKMADQIYMLTSKALGQQMLLIWNGRVVSVQKLDVAINEYLAVLNLTAFEADDLNAAVKP
jgi:hypothetical protein